MANSIQNSKLSAPPGDVSEEMAGWAGTQNSKLKTQNYRAALLFTP
jgi:hypothetical protein